MNKVTVSLVAIGLLAFLARNIIVSLFRLLKLLLRVRMHSYLHGSGAYSFLDTFEAKYDANPDTVQFINAETGKETKVKAVEELANQVAHWALKLGYKQLDTVALLMLNSSDFVSIWLGFGKVGVSVALLNTNNVGKPLVHSCEVALKSSKVKILIVDSELKGKISDEDLERIEGLGVKVLYWDASGADGEGDDSSVKNEVKMHKTTRPGRKHRDTVREKDALLYIFTSGTTGHPKACRITQSKYYLLSLPYRTICGLTSADVIYTTLPMYHSAAGMLGVGSALTCGATMVFRKKFSASKFSADCLKYKVTTVQYIGELCRYLISADKNKDDAKLSTIKYAFGNGLAKDNWLPFQRRYNIAHIVEFYGATEGTAGLLNNMDRVGALGFIPRVLDFIYPLNIVKVDEEDKTKPLRDKHGRCINCSIGEVGLLLNKISKSADRRFDGYTDEKSTSDKLLHDVFTKGDSYFNTGDLLSRDWLGFYYWSDRVGDTFRWKGENVSTSEVLSVVDHAKTVKDCVVYGVEVPGCEGRAGMAAIVPASGVSDSDLLSDLADACKKNLPAYSRPLFLRVKAKGEELETTSTFKHVKTKLVKEAFNPEEVGDDKLFYRPSADAKYEELDEGAYKKIQDKKIKF